MLHFAILPHKTQLSQYHSSLFHTPVHRKMLVNLYGLLSLLLPSALKHPVGCPSMARTVAMWAQQLLPR